MPVRLPAILVLAATLSAATARADTLVVCTEGSPDFLNAALSTANTSFDVTEQTSDRLVGMEVGGSKLVPALAESWTVSEDGLTYTLQAAARGEVAVQRRLQADARVRCGRCGVQLQPHGGQGLASISYLSFRTDRKPMNDIKVREALTVAVDLDSLVRAVSQGNGTPTAAMVPPALWSHDTALKPRAYDPARAKQLLTEAGYPDGFETDLWAIPVARAYMPNGRRAAEMIQADWAKIGVKARIVTYEWGEYLKRARSGEATVAMLGGTWDYPDPSQLLLAWGCEAMAAGRNTAFWCSKAYSDALTQANQVSDIAERTKLFIAAQQAFYDEMPGLLFADVNAYVATRSNVQGFTAHFLGGQPFGGTSLTP